MKNPSKKIIVVGTGFKGMMAALNLVKRGFKVTMIDGSKNFGGVLNSPKWEDMYIDLGCHLFFNQEDELTRDILEVLSGEYKTVPNNYGSYFRQQLTEDIAIPNFELLDPQEKDGIYYDMLHPKEIFPEVTSLQQFYVNRFGKKATKWINHFIEKAYRIRSEKLDLMANFLLPYNRIRVFSVKEALKLKEEQYFDDKIAIPRKSNLKERTENINKKAFNFFEYYPLNNGLHFFCERLKEILIEKGVEIQLGNSIESIESKDEFIVKIKNEKIKAPYLYWAAPQYLLPKIFKLDIDLQSFLHPVPLILYYFTVDKETINDFTYIQNYDLEDFCFRVSIQSNYADNNIPKDVALICCEVPSKVDSNVWHNSERFTDQIWEEVVKMGICKSPTYQKSNILKTPSAFTLPLKGYLDGFNKVKERLPLKNILGIRNWDYAKNDILKDIHNEINDIL